MKKQIKAFTLSELVIAMIVLAVLLSIIIPSFVEYLDYAGERQARSNGEELYMAASAAVETTFTLHKSEYVNALNKTITYVSLDDDGNEVTLRSEKYGRLSTSGLCSTQHNTGTTKDFDYIAGFESFYKGSSGKQAGDALIAKYTLINLDALYKNPDKIREQYRFSHDIKPAGNDSATENVHYTVEQYQDYVSQNKYKVNGKTYTCNQAGVIIEYGVRDGKGEIIYTEYGDKDGYLIICINPVWYPTMKEQLKEVQLHPLPEDEEELRIKDSVENPIVIVVRNGTYESGGKS